MRRVMVLGPPGSGKSTLAREIGAVLGVPVFHLDQAFWQPGWLETPPEAFAAEVERMAALPEWVIDGNYTGTIEPRLRSAEALVYLDVPNWLSMLRILRRTFTFYGRIRPDAAPGCAERVDLGFLRFAWSWNKLRRPRNLARVAQFSGFTMVVRTAEDRARLMASIQPATAAATVLPPR